MTPLSMRRYVAVLAGGAAVVVALILLSPGMGTVRVGVVEAWGVLLRGETSTPAYDIAFSIRLPRALKALMAGATLALCGAVCQTLFRNPLATPYTLGIASGGSLGALIAFKAGWIGLFCGFSAVQLFAFAGALAVVGLVFGMARSSIKLQDHALLLAGVTLGFFCSAMMMFITYLADVRDTFRIVRWMMGSLDTVGMQSAPLLVVLVPCWLILVTRARALSQFELGDEIAASRGVRPARLQLVCIVVASVATAMVVSVCGPIGFVGLIVPHIVRLVAGPDKRLLLPASALGGGAFLIVCDWLTWAIPGWYGALAGRELSAARLPIGVMTALVGAPLFLVLLRRRLR
ncbi:MAG: iron ABC transporter permease [bacterium]|nr:iron ABC transporter permease [bacterium]